MAVDKGRHNTYALAYMKPAIGTALDVFRAFADPTRLRILNLLIEGEVCVCDLCNVLGEIQPKVSRHLAYLRRAGLVEVRRDGKWILYRIAKSTVGIERTLINCVKSCLRDTDVMRNDLDRLRSVPSAGCR